MLFNLDDLKNALQNEIIKIDTKINFNIKGIAFDNRELSDNFLFIARKGENNDGHNFIKVTLENNPTVYILAQYLPKDITTNLERIVLVKDTMIAFKKLAIFSRARFKGVVIGITGSMGKTTVKDLFYHCFNKINKSYCNQYSFNNYNGILVTLVNTPKDAKYAIYEIGMNQKNEMDILIDLIKPEIAIITNVELAHSEFFKTGEEIAFEKAKILSKYADTIVLNLDNKYYNYLSNLAKKEKNIKNILTFSKNINNSANINLKNYIINNNLEYEIEYLSNKINFSFKTKNLDKNFAVNLMPILCVAQHLGLDLNIILKNAIDFETTRGRNNFETTEYIFNKKTIHLGIINGSYNAVNPKAYESGFQLMQILGHKYLRKVCIFGGIHEAGANSELFNSSLFDPIVETKIDLLILVGEAIKPLYKKIQQSVVDFTFFYFETAELAIERIKTLLYDKDLVFIKSSKGVKTYKILNYLSKNPMKIFN